MAFLRCGVVIALSLVAARAGAQTHLIFHCHAQYGGFPYTVTLTCRDRGDSVGTMNAFGAVQVLPIDTTVIVEQDGLFFSFNGLLSFYIDSTNRQIRNLRLWGTGATSNYTGGANYSIFFDTLEYEGGIQSGIIVSERHIPAAQCFDTVSINEGGCSGSAIQGSLISIDTLQLFINNVSSVQSAQDQKSLRLCINANDENIASFFPSSISRALEVFDELGAMRISVSIGATQTIACLGTGMLPPGCYFARLGNQVAKFMVPAR